jgi:hypothetical protein
VRTADGHWAVDGRARVLSTPRYGYRVARAADGRLDVLRTGGLQAQARATTLMVPYRVTLAEGAAAHDGQLFLEGQEDAFHIETDRQPVDLRLDPQGELLAWFYSERRHPKRVMRYEAAELALAGRLDEAERRFREALAQPADTQGPVDPLGPPIVEPRIDARIEDLHIRLGLVRIAIERGADDAAQAELSAIDAALAGDDQDLLRMERDALQARLEMRRGATDRAHRRLERTLRAAVPPRGVQSWSGIMQQVRLRAERLATVEAFALLALASHELDEREDLEWALREARDRGADVTVLLDETAPAPG